MEMFRLIASPTVFSTDLKAKLASIIELSRVLCCNVGCLWLMGDSSAFMKAVARVIWSIQGSVNACFAETISGNTWVLAALGPLFDQSLESAVGSQICPPDSMDINP